MKFLYENKITFYYNIISKLIAIGALVVAIYFGIENSNKQDTIDELRQTD